MAIDINYKVTGLEGLETALTSLASRLDSIDRVFGNIIKENTPTASVFGNANELETVSEKPYTSLFKGGGGLGDVLFNKTLSDINQTYQNFNRQTDKFFKTLEDLPNSLNELNSNIEKQGVSPEPSNNLQVGGEGGGISNSSPLQSLGGLNKGLILGAEALLNYLSRGFGSAVGYSGATLNTGLPEYSDFETNYKNKLLGSQSSALSTGLTIASSLGANALISTGNPYGIAGGLGILALSGIAQYITGEKTEEKSQQNQLISNQDILSYRLRTLGRSGSGSYLGGSGDYNLEDAVNNIQIAHLQGGSQLSNIQRLAISNGSYPSTISDVYFKGRRDVLNSLSDQDVVNFNDSINKLSLQTGIDVGTLSGSVTQLSKVTGISPERTSEQLLNNFVKFGGDTASNTSQIVQLLQSTAFNFSDANSAVNRLQYDTPALQNLIGVKTASPFNSFNASILGRIGGLSQQELDQGLLSKEHRDEYIKAINDGRHGRLTSADIISQIRANAIQSLGGNPLANISGQIESSGRLTQVGDTSLIKDFKDKLNEQLKNLTVENQYVSSPTSVNIYTNDSSINYNSNRGVNKSNIRTVDRSVKR